MQMMDKRSSGGLDRGAMTIVAIVTPPFAHSRLLTSRTMGRPKRKHEPESGEDELKPDIGDDELKPNIDDNDQKPKVGDVASRARAWSAAEQQLLLKLVVEKGTTEAFKSVPGRTYNQSRLAWR